MSIRLAPPLRHWFPALCEEHLVFVGTDQLLGRVYPRGGDHPTTWNGFRTYGPVKARFDHHPRPRRDHPRRAIAYGACQGDDPVTEVLTTCLLERYQDTRTVDRVRDEPHFALHRPTRPLVLLNLSSRWIAAARGNAAISSGPHGIARMWSKAIYRHYTGTNAGYLDHRGDWVPALLDGLWYRCSLLPDRRSIALYERARTSLPTEPEADIPLSTRALDRFMDTALSAVGLSVAPRSW